MPRTAIFGYGSLADPRSVALTLGREVEPIGRARLRGWRRRWSQVRDNPASEKTFEVGPQWRVPRWILGLNVEPGEDGRGDAAPNGVLLEVSETELGRLDVRELRYDRVDVTDAVATDAEVDRVITYRAKAEHYAAEPPDGAVILAPYVEAVEAAFARLGPGALALFRETTGPPPVDVVPARLVRDRIPPGNPRDW